MPRESEESEREHEPSSMQHREEAGKVSAPSWAKRRIHGRVPSDMDRAQQDRITETYDPKGGAIRGTE